MELTEIQRLQKVRNSGALRTLQLVVGNLAMAAKSFEQACQIGHEKAADDLLTAASELLKRVEGK